MKSGNAFTNPEHSKGDEGEESCLRSISGSVFSNVMFQPCDQAGIKGKSGSSGHDMESTPFFGKT